MPATVDPHPEYLDRQFGRDLLGGQFVLGRDVEVAPSGWLRNESGGSVLASHPTLPVVHLRARDETDLGWLIGYPVSAGSLVRDILTMDVDADAPGEAIEEHLYALGGRWAAVLTTLNRIYLDPAGSLSLVYCPSRRTVASTASLIPYDAGTADRQALIRALQVPWRNGFHPFGLTARKGVARLLPNHYLDLDLWQASRHWPREPFDTDGNVGDAVDEITARIRENIGAVAAECPLHLSLTAGRDSRVLLACARDVVAQTHFFTIALPDKTARIDVFIAQKIAERFRLNHSVLEHESAGNEERNLWAYRTASCVGEERGMDAVRAYGQLDRSRAELPGLCGEVGRNFYHRPGAAHRYSPEGLVDTLRLGRHPELVEAAAQWQEGLPIDDPRQQVDFLYIEQRLGCWGGLLPYGDPESTRFRLYPLCGRRIFELMLGLPFAYRDHDRLPADIIRRAWPELLQFPFNRYTGLRQARAYARRRVFLARRAVARVARGGSGRGT